MGGDDDDEDELPPPPRASRVAQNSAAEKAPTRRPAVAAAPQITRTGRVSRPVLPTAAAASTPRTHERARAHGWAHPVHLCTGTGLTPSTSAPGLGSPRPPLHRDWAHPRPASAAGLGSPPASICTGTGLTPGQHLHRDRLPSPSKPRGAVRRGRWRAMCCGVVPFCVEYRAGRDTAATGCNR